MYTCYVTVKLPFRNTCRHVLFLHILFYLAESSRQHLNWGNAAAFRLGGCNLRSVCSVCAVSLKNVYPPILYILIMINVNGGWGGGSPRVG